MRFFLLLLLLLAVIIVGGVFALQAPTTWQRADIVQTPDDRFNNLEGFAYEPNYVDALGYRIHYVDEGPADGEVILLMHGQPSWSYLYRHMIDGLAAAGYRVIVPDLVGFGRSDKPLKQSDHSYQMHVDVTAEFVRQLDLSGITLFAQDWGGLIGLRLAPEMPDRFSRIMISNTGLPAAGGLRGWIGYPLFKIAVWREGKPETLAMEDGEFSFPRWVAWAMHSDQFDIEGLFQSATVRELTSEELAGYAAPFPDETYQAAIRVFPYLVPSQLRQNQKVLDEFYANWEKPFITAFSDSDPVTRGFDIPFQELVPGAQGQAHVTIAGGHHFIQEDQPQELVRLLTAFIEANPAP